MKRPDLPPVGADRVSGCRARPWGWLALSGVLAGAAGCGGGGCEPPAAVFAMTPSRARTLLPGLETGLAVSTAVDLGSCPVDVDERSPLRCAGQIPGCGLLRRSLDVYVIPLGGSLEIGPDCTGGFLTRGMRPIGRSSEGGEWVGSLEPGGYYLAAARPGDGCAECGALQDGASCVVRIRPGRVTVRELVL